MQRGICWYLLVLSVAGWLGSMQPVTAAAAQMTAVALAATPASPRPAGTVITLTATPTGATNVEYQFWVRSYTYGTTAWTLLRDYQTANSCQWTPTSAGTYQLTVWARQPDGAENKQCTRAINYNVTGAAASITVTLQVGAATPALITKPVTLTAAASATNGVTYQFAVGYQGTNGVEWTNLGTATTTKTATWTPTRVGAYTVRVTAKKTGSADAVATQPITILPLSGAALGTQLAVALYKGDRLGAISFTLDDGLQSQVQYALPALNMYGFKATFGLVGNAIREKRTDPPVPTPEGWVTASWEDWRMALSQGHELANHSLNHSRPLTIITDDEELDVEVNRGRDVIGEQTGIYPISMIYPGNGYDTRVRAVVQQQHYIERLDQYWYGRFDNGTSFTVSRANSIADYAMSERLWIVPMLHGFAPNEYAYLETSVFQQHLAYLKQREGSIWVDTFANIGRYVRERDTAVLALTAIGSTQREFTLTTPLNDTVFAYPLTVVVLTGGNTAPQQVRATCDGDALPVSATVGRILVDVQPNGLPVVVTWQ